MSIENRDDELGFPDSNEDVPYRTRSGRISKPYDFATKFPETAHYQGCNLTSNEDGVYLRPCYYYSKDVT